MTCRDAQRRLHTYLDGDLADPERVALEAHLSGCATCRQAMADARAEEARLKGRLPVPPLTAGFTNHVMAVIKSRRPRRQWPPRLVWLAAAGLAVLAGLWLAVAYFMRPDERGPTAFQIAQERPEEHPSRPEPPRQEKAAPPEPVPPPPGLKDHEAVRPEVAGERLDSFRKSGPPGGAGPLPSAPHRLPPARGEGSEVRPPSRSTGPGTTESSPPRRSSPPDRWPPLPHRVAVLMKAAGTVEVRRAGMDSWRVVSLPTPLRPGDALRTGGLATITWERGGTARLNRGAAVRFREEGLELQAGELFVEVASRPTPFMVRTPGGTVRVLGTRFGVEWTGWQTVVTVVEGVVGLANAHGRVVLNGGEQARATADAPPTEPYRVALEQFVGWAGVALPEPVLLSGVTWTVQPTAPAGVFASGEAATFLVDVAYPEGWTEKLTLQAVLWSEQNLVLAVQTVNVSRAAFRYRRKRVSFAGLGLGAYTAEFWLEGDGTAERGIVAFRVGEGEIKSR